MIQRDDPVSKQKAAFSLPGEGSFSFAALLTEYFYVLTNGWGWLYHVLSKINFSL